MMNPNRGRFAVFVRPFVILTSLACAWARVHAADPGEWVVVVYNSRLPESKQVAEYYAQRRDVPSGQVLGFSLPVTESMTRTEFTEQLQKPLLSALEAKKLFVFQEKPRRLVDARVRYAALCYGVPIKILRDSNLVERATEQLPDAMRRNEASVDSELACLPVVGPHFALAGPANNPAYTATNRTQLSPTNGVFVVTRLDGPTPAIARGLVDKSIEAETNGLWGRAYFDARGLTNGDHLLGDNWIRASAQVCRRLGFETELDLKPETFSAGFPMSHIALYAGWYEAGVSGPFTRPTVEFMPGAVAYHLHSFNAYTIRSATEHWVGPLLAKGVTATFGSVEEPYLSGTPDLAIFFTRFIYLGFSFGEAFYAAQNSVSWQNLAVGDPLFRPFSIRPDLLLPELEKRGSRLVDWYHVHFVNINLAQGAPLDDAVSYLDKQPVTRKSSVLLEKLADIYWAKKNLSDALDTYEQALKFECSSQQRARLLLTLASKRAFYGPDQIAFNYYQQFLKEYPEWPDLLLTYQRLLPLAKKLDKKEVVEKCEAEIKRLTPPPPAPPPTTPAKP